MLQTVPLLLLGKSCSNLLLPRRLLQPRRIVMALSAPEDVALNKTGTAAQMVCTVLLMLETAHLLLLRKSLSSLLLPRRLLPPKRIVMALSALEDVALNKTGTAAQMVCTVLPMLEIVPLLEITFRSLLCNPVIKYF